MKFIPFYPGQHLPVRCTYSENEIKTGALRSPGTMIHVKFGVRINNLVRQLFI